MDDVLVEQKQMLWCNGKCLEFEDGGEPLLTDFMGVSDMVVEGNFISQHESKVFKALHHLNCLTIYGCEVMGSAEKVWSTSKYIFFRLFFFTLLEHSKIFRVCLQYIAVTGAYTNVISRYD